MPNSLAAWLGNAGAAALALTPSAAYAADAINLLSYAAPGQSVDRSGQTDASSALASAITAANLVTARGEPACVFIPPGRYRISKPPPPFARAGCVKGEGPTQSILILDKSFEGDLFAWSEAWVMTTPGPTVVGLKVIGNKTTDKLQNAMVFYDRNDNVFIDNVEVEGLHGRALYSGITKNAPIAYMRESHLRSLRFFDDGTATAPVVEFTSQGKGHPDATNAIDLSQVDVYGARGGSFVIRNDGNGVVRSITIEALRVEGSETGSTHGNLLQIGDPLMRGNVNNIRMIDVRLIDPPSGYAAFWMTAAQGTTAPYEITLEGTIGGGVPKGQGLRIDAGRTSVFRLTGINTVDTNVVIGKGVSGIVLDGGGQQRDWTYKVAPSSAGGLAFPLLRYGVSGADQKQ
jgi:hypothetical protein